jgi:hypothetical protein
VGTVLLLVVVPIRQFLTTKRLMGFQTTFLQKSNSMSAQAVCRMQPD